MNILDFKGDEKKEEQGVWLPLEDAEFLIGAHGNKAHRKALDRHRHKLAGMLRKQDSRAGELLTIEAAADGLLLDWRGKVEENGQPLPYSRENAIKLLQIRFLREWVVEQALNMANFRGEEEAAETAALKSGDGVSAAMG